MKSYVPIHVSRYLPETRTEIPTEDEDECKK